jgi:ABC-type multidrug transport system fused ATPase/permease subunit
LIQLLGWKCFVPGLLAPFIATPLVNRASKSYSESAHKVGDFRDASVNTVKEALQTIRQIRFSGLEDLWVSKISKFRQAELEQVWKSCISGAMFNIPARIAPFLLASVSLSLYSWFNGQLPASVAFPALGIFSQLDTALGELPLLVSFFAYGWKGFLRLENFLNEPEKHNVTVPSDSILFKDANITWPKDNEVEKPSSFTLRNVNISFPMSELSIICGKTGSGKSLLLAAILGEINLSGEIGVPPRPDRTEYDTPPTKSTWIFPSAMAFVSQDPWIENGTVKDNILFGLPLDIDRYSKVVYACDLNNDLKLLSKGDETQVGPKGVQLSGGQRWRLALARALYSRAGILVMDDVFSAVDPHVGKWLYENALLGELAHNRTRILATHHVSLCSPGAAYVVLLSESTVRYAGGTRGTEFATILESVLPRESNSHDLGRLESRFTAPEAGKEAGAKKIPEASNASKFIGEKNAAKHSKVSVYWAYFQATGGWTLCGAFLLLILCRIIASYSPNWWLKEWSSSYDENTSSLNSTTITTMRYIAIYNVIEISAYLIVSLELIFGDAIGLRAGAKLYDQMVLAVLRAPLRWIDTTPSGEIMNRFASEMQNVDRRIMHQVGGTVSSILQLVIIVAMR